jgi:SP family facilitated glucose transporter-like MFS transporter 1
MAEVNVKYLFFWVVTISIGMFQFGLAMGNYNFLTTLIPMQLGWEKDLCNSILGTAAPLGAAIGAISGGFIAAMGRRFALLLINVVITAAIFVSLLKYFTTILIGRFFMGMCAGAFSVISPLFISEICPPQLSGPFGVINQFMVTFGIVVIYVLGIFIVPYDANVAEVLDSDSWRYLFGFPLIFVVVQVALLLFVFRADSAKYYSQKGET